MCRISSLNRSESTFSARLCGCIFRVVVGLLGVVSTELSDVVASVTIVEAGIEVDFGELLVNGKAVDVEAGASLLPPEDS